ncbi:MAG TPA: glycosyltransferase [Actinomycetota bacterium]|nr:glycosyltransferase [Actinomycetota bacterium]
MQDVPLSPRPLDGLSGLARARDLDRFRRTAAELARLLDGRATWHVNATSSGGGVAELLHQVLGYVLDAGIACRWVVVEGDGPFFRVTKRIHNRLHGSLGDGGGLDAEERRVYGSVVRGEASAFLDRARAGDVAILHDPQTAGLTGPLKEAGLRVVWVCHVGVDTPGEVARSAWDFLRPEIEPADAYVFSRDAYVWEGLDPRKAHVIPPCIDPTSPKNAELGATSVGAILGAAGILGPFEAWGQARVESPALGTVRVRRRADLVEDDPVPGGAPIAVQVSRWDRLKDHLGVLEGFAAHADPHLDAHLLLVGPSPSTVSDDPEGAEVFAEIRDAWKELPAEHRARIHLVNLPVEDRIENAVVVNALQRRADVVIQKSLAEGFGLTVAEAMWKARPVIGSAVGGIQDQIVDGVSGLLVSPTDPAGMGRAISTLIGDLGYAQAIGHAARKRIRDRFLPPHFVRAHLEVVRTIVG